jgi:hypothetical protein
MYAIGKKGGTVRMFVDVVPDNRMLQPGEIAVPVAAGFTDADGDGVPDGGGTISAAGVFVPAPAATGPTIADIEAQLLADVDRTREQLEMTVLSAGGAKKYVYSRKAVEAIDARTLVASVLNALSLTDKQRRFPFANAETLLTKEAISVVLARFEAAMVLTTTQLARIDAIAQVGKRAIRAATTIAAKRTAFANISWSA